eukprot:Gb_19233 [translate_table: standard]
MEGAICFSWSQHPKNATFNVIGTERSLRHMVYAVSDEGWLSGLLHMEDYTTTFFIIAILFAIHKGNAIDHNVDWEPMQVTANTDFSNNWTGTSKFFVGDELDFRLNNDRDYIAQVSESAYLSCSADCPIAIYSDKTVIKLNRTGNWYFIHGSPRDCKFGQKLLIRVILNVRAYNSSRAEIGYREGNMVKIATGGGGGGRGGGRGRGRNFPKGPVDRSHRRNGCSTPSSSSHFSNFIFVVVLCSVFLICPLFSESLL